VLSLKEPLSIHASKGMDARRSWRALHDMDIQFGGSGVEVTTLPEKSNTYLYVWQT
jgi:hypothetical protein